MTPIPGTSFRVASSGTALALSLTGCGPTPDAPVSRLDLTSCELPGVEAPVLCGRLEVLEDREAGEDRTIGLRVAVVPPTDPDSTRDPVFVLVGGPGQSAVDNAASYLRLLADVGKQRALVFVDQRGTGESNPLPCDLHAQHPSGVLGDFMPPDAVSACRAQLEPIADLRFYTSELAAQDLDDVRKALGYEQINLEAASYGTRVALLYLRKYGANVRSVVLRSVSPPWARQPLDFASDAQAALDSLVNACERESTCRSAFPRLTTELDSVLRRLDREPAPVTLPGADSAAPARNIRLARGPFAEKLRFMLYAPSLSSLVPTLIHQAFNGNYVPFAELADEIGRQIARLGRNGMYLSVTCTEDVAKISPEEAAASRPGTFLVNYRVDQQVAACRLWPQGSVSREFADPVVSEVPVLLISSTIDPITPPRLADQAAKGLRNSVHLLVPDGGHSPATPCVMGIVTQFIRTASPTGLDTACLAESRRPPFVVERP